MFHFFCIKSQLLCITLESQGNQVLIILILVEFTYCNEAKIQNFYFSLVAKHLTGYNWTHSALITSAVDLSENEEASHQNCSCSTTHVHIGHFQCLTLQLVK